MPWSATVRPARRQRESGERGSGKAPDQVIFEMGKGGSHVATEGRMFQQGTARVKALRCVWDDRGVVRRLGCWMEQLSISSGGEGNGGSRYGEGHSQELSLGWVEFEMSY